MTKTIGAILLLAAAMFAAPHAPRCALPTVETGVLCCCHTRNGLCCAEVAFCGGYVPGCFCS